MLSKSQSKHIRSLRIQKYRKQYNCFVVEGEKIAREWLLSSKTIHTIAAMPEWLSENEMLLKQHAEATVISVTGEELASISTLQTPNKVLLVADTPAAQILPVTGWNMALDSIQDPGNLGAIIRVADWFGITQVVCSADCADAYNPKVVQAAMGGHLRVNICKTDLVPFLSQSGMPVFAATLNGDDIYTLGNEPKGVLVIGNESKGISAPVLKIAARQITIPRFGGAESLNAAVSAGILCAFLLKTC